MTKAEYIKRWRKEHPEKVRQYNAKYKATHEEQIREYQRQYKRDHPVPYEKTKEAAHRYYQRHREKFLQYYQDKKEVYAQYRREHKAEHLRYARAYNERRQVERAAGSNTTQVFGKETTWTQEKVLEYKKVWLRWRKLPAEERRMKLKAWRTGWDMTHCSKTHTEKGTPTS